MYQRLVKFLKEQDAYELYLTQAAKYLQVTEDQVEECISRSNYNSCDVLLRSSFVFENSDQGADFWIILYIKLRFELSQEHKDRYIELVEAFKQFLKDRDAYKAYKRNALSNLIKFFGEEQKNKLTMDVLFQLTRDSSEDLFLKFPLHSSFDWTCTPEGYEYWKSHADAWDLFRIVNSF